MALQRIINSVFAGGIDRLLSYRMAPDQSIVGQFVDRRQIYDYTLSPNNRLTYVEADTKRSDAYWQALESEIRTDFLKAKQCQTGKPCGSSCVAKGLKCNQQLSGTAAAQANAARAAMPGAKKTIGGQVAPKSGFPSGAIAAAVTTGVLGVAAGATAATLLARRTNEEETLLPHITPQQNQQYDDSFPNDEAFDKAKFESPKAVFSGEKLTGTHKIYQVKVGKQEFFAKAESEAGIAKEVSSFEIAKEVGLESSVLPARRVYHNGQPHVVNPQLSKEDIQSLGSDKQLSKVVKALPKEKIAEMVLFDYAIHNYDRHSGNLLARQNGDVLLIDHGAVKWDLPSQISTKLDTKRNFFFKQGLDSNPNAEIPEAVLQRFSSKRERIREITAYRYAGQPKKFVDPVLDKLDQRFDVIDSMLESGDRRVKHLINGKPVGKLRQSETFDKKEQQGRVINGIPLKTSDPNDYKKTDDNTSFQEPAWLPHLKGVNKKSGTAVIEPDGRLWLYEPANHYAGTKNTFAKGGVEADLTPQQSAIKEAREELGLKIKIIDHLGDFSHVTGEKIKAGDKDKAVIRHYLAVRTGGSPADAHWEADKVKLLTPDDARKALNKGRDQKILDAVSQYTTSAEGLQRIQSAHRDVVSPKSAPWSPAMTPREAEDWVKDSAYKKTTYHATSGAGADGITKTGFRLSFRKVGRAYGNGVYVGLQDTDVDHYRQLYPDGVTLSLKTNLKKVLDVDKEMKKAETKGIFGETQTRRPQDTMRGIAENLGQKDDFDRLTRYIRKENARMKAGLRSGKLSQDVYNQQYADFPESEAFSYIAQKSGYDAIKLTGGRANIGMMVVFDPKKVTVVKD